MSAPGQYDYEFDYYAVFSKGATENQLKVKYYVAHYYGGATVLWPTGATGCYARIEPGLANQFDIYYGSPWYISTEAAGCDITIPMSLYPVRSYTVRSSFDFRVDFDVCASQCVDSFSSWMSEWDGSDWYAGPHMNVNSHCELPTGGPCPYIKT